jgi:hypothetical protein
MSPLYSVATFLMQSKREGYKETSSYSTKKKYGASKQAQGPTPKRRVLQEAFKVFAPKEVSKQPSGSQYPSREELHAVLGLSPNKITQSSILLLRYHSRNPIAKSPDIKVRTISP